MTIGFPSWLFCLLSCLVILQQTSCCQKSCRYQRQRVGASPNHDSWESPGEWEACSTFSLHEMSCDWTWRKQRPCAPKEHLPRHEEGNTPPTMDGDIHEDHEEEEVGEARHDVLHEHEEEEVVAVPMHNDWEDNSAANVVAAVVADAHDDENSRRDNQTPVRSAVGRSPWSRAVLAPARRVPLFDFSEENYCLQKMRIICSYRRLLSPEKLRSDALCRGDDRREEYLAWL